jgi:hypothetical protein
LCEGREDLALLVAGGLSTVPGAPVAAVVDFYLAAREAAIAILLDSADQKPQYSLRTLSRAMEYVRAAAPLYGRTWQTRHPIEGHSTQEIDLRSRTSVASDDRT